MSNVLSTKNFKVQILLIIGCLKYSFCQYQNSRCSNKLENALEQMLRRNEMKSNSRTYIDLSPYSVYHSLYHNDAGGAGVDVGDDYSYDGHGDGGIRDSLSRELPIAKVEVADLKVRLPNNMRWVQVDKCHFNANNRTLDTRLLFPDLTISGKVILHPAGGRCNMILRLRRAGIEFRTVPLTGTSNGVYDEQRRSGTASVRTDSHFAEPGFLSVFAHGCQGPYGVKVRQNSKRRQFDTDDMKWSRYNSIKSIKNRRHDVDDHQNNQMRDFMEFNDDVLDHNDDGIRYPMDDSRMLNNLVGPFQNNYYGDFRNDRRHHYNNKHNPFSYGQNYNNWHNAERPTNSEEVNEALMRELEKLFSMGVRGLLTTYMQKTLQPAIKETLMQNMGYTISYG